MSTHAHVPLEEGCFYHIYNRGNGSSNLFYQDRNYIRFLKKYEEYLAGSVDTYAYCLLPNHFHILIQVKKRSDFQRFENSFPTAADLAKYTAEELVSESFRRFFMSYSKSINVQEKRNGSLFQKTFRRKFVDCNRYFNKVVHYIHHQTEHHGFRNADYRTYPWSSYQAILGNRETFVKRAELFDRFGGRIGFQKFHGEIIPDPDSNVALED